jgi:hypothetical protein
LTPSSIQALHTLASACLSAYSIQPPLGSLLPYSCSMEYSLLLSFQVQPYSGHPESPQPCSLTPTPLLPRQSEPEARLQGLKTDVAAVARALLHQRRDLAERPCRVWGPTSCPKTGPSWPPPWPLSSLVFSSGP